MSFGSLACRPPAPEHAKVLAHRHQGREVLPAQPDFPPPEPWPASGEDAVLAVTERP